MIGFKGGATEPWTPELGPNKFQERLSDASRMKENLLAAGAQSRTPLGELTALPRPTSLWGGAGCPLPKNSTPLSHL